MIYGRNAVRETLKGKREVRSVFMAAGARGKEGDGLEDAVRKWAKNAGVDTPSVSHMQQRELTELLGTPDHQGIAAEVDPYPYTDSEELLAKHSVVVALDRIQDPQNLGAIVRTAEAAGAGVIITRHRAAAITGAVVKASAGATEHASIAQVRNLGDTVALAKQQEFWIYGAAAEAEASYTSQDYTYPTFFLLGSEGTGLGQRVSALCDVLVSLPLFGTVGSLNVSVSTGILLYEALRQRRSEQDGSLPH